MKLIWCRVQGGREKLVVSSHVGESRQQLNQLEASKKATRQVYQEGGGEGGRPRKARVYNQSARTCDSIVL